MEERTIAQRAAGEAKGPFQKLAEAKLPDYCREWQLDPAGPLRLRGVGGWVVGLCHPGSSGKPSAGLC